MFLASDRERSENRVTKRQSATFTIFAFKLWAKLLPLEASSCSPLVSGETRFLVVGLMTAITVDIVLVFVNMIILNHVSRMFWPASPIIGVYGGGGNPSSSLAVNRISSIMPITNIHSPNDWDLLVNHLDTINHGKILEFKPENISETSSEASADRHIPILAGTESLTKSGKLFMTWMDVAALSPKCFSVGLRSLMSSQIPMLVTGIW